MELAYCLGQSGQESEAEKIYRRLEARYPDEFTFYFSHARLLFRQKNKPIMAEKALSLAQKAFNYSYGDNRLRAALLLGQILSSQGRNQEAQSLINESLKGAEAPSDPFNRTQRYIAQLKAFNTLQNQNTP